MSFCSPSFVVLADTVPAGGRYLTVNETREFIGSTFEVTYYNGSDYVTTTATYDTYTTFYSETSENPSGFFTGTTWLKYSVTMSGINSSPAYVTVHCEPSYSLFDTEYVYTCFALQKVTNMGISSSAYQSPNSDWYMGGSNINFANRNESASGSGVYAYLTMGNGAQCSYIPIVHRQQNTFSAYSIDAEFSGGYSTLSNFFVMCPYVSNNASGASGTFDTSAVTTGTNSGGVSVDLSGVESQLAGVGDDVGLIVSAILDDSDVPDVDEPMETCPPRLDIDEQMMITAKHIMDDIPDTVAAMGFWVELCNALFPSAEWFRVLVPALILIALLTYVLWGG